MPKEVEDREKRIWAWVQAPDVYGVTCDLCDGLNIAWSEWDHMIWCYDCEKDTKGTDGIFNGPVNVHCCELLGMIFDEVNIETGEVRTLESSLFLKSFSDMLE